jgi:hypothetical protein
MSKTTILVVCAFAGAVILGTTTTTPAAPGNGIPARVAALETAIADLADQLAEHDHDSMYVKTPGEPIAVIRGVINADASVRTGSGFVVTYEGDGIYQITYNADSFHGGVSPFVHALGPTPDLAFVTTPVNASGFRVKVATDGQQAFRFVSFGSQ